MSLSLEMESRQDPVKGAISTVANAWSSMGLGGGVPWMCQLLSSAHGSWWVQMSKARARKYRKADGDAYGGLMTELPTRRALNHKT